MNKLLVHCADVAVRFLQCYIFPPAFKMVVFDKKIEKDILYLGNIKQLFY